MLGILAANTMNKANKPQNIEMDLYKKLRNMKMLLIDDDEWIRAQHFL